MVKLKPEQKKQYLNAIANDIFHKEYKQISEQEKIRLEVNLLACLSSKELTDDEYQQLKDAITGDSQK